MRKPLLILPLLWFFAYLVFYGINFGIGHLNGSIYLNGQISSGAQIVSQALSGVLVSTLGRRLSLSISSFMGGIACILYYSVAQDATGLSYLCLLIGKFGSSCALFTVHFVSIELVPTVFRGAFFGICTIFGGTGGTLAPLTDGFADSYFMYIYGSFGIVSGLLALLLRETKDKEMIDLEEECKKKRIRENSQDQDGCGTMKSKENYSN